MSNSELLTNDQLEAKLQQCPRPRVTKEYIKTRIKETQFVRTTPTLTTAILVMDNGFFVTGESACVNPDNYDEDIAHKVAFENAFNKLWPLFGFLLAEAQGRMPVGEFAYIEKAFPAWGRNIESAPTPAEPVSA